MKEIFGKHQKFDERLLSYLHSNNLHSVVVKIYNYLKVFKYIQQFLDEASAMVRNS